MTTSVAPTGAPPHRDDVAAPEPGPCKVLVVAVASQRIGILAADVIEIQPVVAISPLPGAPAAIEGVIDLRGQPIPVLGARRRLGAEPRDVQLSDRLVVVRTRERLVALRVDAALDVADVSVVNLERATSLTADHLRGSGLARLDGGLLVVHDVAAFLSPDEVDDLEGALARIGDS